MPIPYDNEEATIIQTAGVPGATPGIVEASKAVVVDENNYRLTSFNTLEVDTKIVCGTKIEAGKSNNKTSNFGKAAIGNVADQDWAGFSHEDCTHVSKYALLQDELSNTKLNAGALKNLTFNIAGLEQMRINASGNVEMGFIQDGDPLRSDYQIIPDDIEKFAVSGNIKATGFVTGGFLRMGEGAQPGSNNTSAQISHVNRYNDTDYAVRQLSYGPTFVNTSATRHIGFRVNNTEYMRVDGNASRLGNVGINTMAPAQKLHVVGGGRFDLDGGQFRIFSGTTGTVDKFSVNGNGVYVSGWLSVSQLLLSERVLALVQRTIYEMHGCTQCESF